MQARPYRLTARTAGFQSANRGSIPRRATEISFNKSQNLPWCTIAQAVDYALEIKPRVVFPVHDGNLVRQNGITVRLPNIELPKVGIKFMALELGKETEL